MPEERLLYRIKVTGRVQGVGFRWHTADKAAQFDIKGYVKNMPDGSVYIEAEGVPENLELFLRWCAEGPANAQVKSVTYDKYPPEDYPEFIVKH